MKKTLKKLGLIVDFDFLYSIDKVKALDLLITTELDKKISFYDSIFGLNLPLKSTDFKYDEYFENFKVKRESKINLRKGRGIITGKIESDSPDMTRVKGTIKSNYEDLKFPVIMFFIFTTIVFVVVILSNEYGLEWLFYNTGFFIVVMSLMVAFQRFEVMSIRKSLLVYFDRLSITKR
ncbi:hypothetical protein EO244_16585 [Ancylomarina salipaludis]|uniref:Uncharacterized protein n=1 Tax=Ancylomarina salipaludis TaxID=2501299 RepID=A0A4Q1JHJ8_9BACT|nr:hypothetical protein [Ancylomarina salipaludis]RXQ87257.1 hypothetical protein EO244_16585 [Ancylomarina salipaludis]